MAKPGLGARHQAIAAIIRKRAAAGEPCHLCGQPIDTRPPEQGGPAPRTRWSFSLDHITPRSKGGQSTLANARPSHYGCNSRRGNGSSNRKTWRPRRW
ncbi:HNH endonuclease [Actinomadura sp. 9N215]|uniref:HNH endonuclease n=1 Tax=Actinomadura sp. 9N215 TaxID=3375150 RepID=UPI003792B4C7